MVTIMQLYINNQTVPSAVETGALILVWRAETGELSGYQTGSWILLERIEPVPALVWDSGWTESDRSQHVSCGVSGFQLASKYRVTVYVRASKGSTAFAEVSFLTAFEKAGLDVSWIGSEDTVPGWLSEKRLLPARYLMRKLLLEKPFRFAPAAVCGLGFYKLYVNGSPVSDARLAPALSNYDKRVYYNVYDLAPFLRQGMNEVLAVLGNGRYFSPRLAIPTVTKTFGLPSLFFSALL